jgi:antitoxin CptB
MDAKRADEPIAIDALEARRRRIRYRAWHRGTKEMDLVLGPYADAHAPRLGSVDLDRLEALMDEADTDLLKWVMGQEVPPPGADTELLRQLIDFRRNTASRT